MTFGRLARSIARPLGIGAIAMAAIVMGLRFEPVVLRDLVAGSEAGRVSVGAVRVPLWSAAWAQASDSFALDNVKFTAGSTSYSAERIEVSGVDSPRAQFEAMLSPTASEPFATRLARVSARQIRIPVLRATQTVGPIAQEIEYRNVILADVVQGRVGLASAEGGGVRSEGGPVRTSMGYGRMSVAELDLPALARLYETKSESGSEPLVRIHGSFSFDAITLTDSEGLTAKIGRVSGLDFLARPTRESWAGTESILTALADKDDLDPADRSRLLQAVGDFLGAFDITSVEATDVEMRFAADSAAGPSTSLIKRMAYRGRSGGETGSFQLEGLETVAEGDRVAIRSLSLTGFDLQAPLDALRRADATTGEFQLAMAREYLPTLGTLRLQGLAADMANEAKSGERMKFAVKAFELTADRPFKGVPTHIRVALENFATDLSAGLEDEGAAFLLDMGYKAVDMSFAAAAEWAEATGEVAITEMTVEGRDMGRLSVTGLLGNVTKDAFDPDVTVASAALQTVKAKSLDIVLHDRGLMDRYLALAAKQEKTTVKALRGNYGMVAAAVVPSALGGTDQAKKVGQAVTRFISKSGSLTVKARTKDAAGLNLFEALTLSGGMAALEKLDLTAVAE